MNFFEYFAQNISEIFSLLVEHIELTIVAVLFAIAIGVPLGILIARFSKTSKPVLAVANVIQAIPSLALLGFLIPLMGIGVVPAVFAVVLYSLLPIIKNTYIGISNVTPDTLEAAKGIGLNKAQVLFKIQIPLALPVIMGGVRIASVTAVGLMTIAAYIGAGGLGYLVFSGIQSVNTNQILAGAIPACLLALFVDFILGLVEKLVTPKSFQKAKATNRKPLFSERFIRVNERVLLGVSTVLIVAALAFSPIKKAVAGSYDLTIGSKDFTEQKVIGNLAAEYIEDKTDLKVERKFGLGGTKVCFEALQNDELDFYYDYSGTAYVNLLGHDPISDVEKVYETSKEELKEQYGIEMLSQTAFNNTYCFAVRQDTAEQYGLSKISDLVACASSLKGGFTFEFSNREDGLAGVEATYGFHIGSVSNQDGALRYLALANGDVDIIDAFSTDGLLKKYDLTVLEDDRRFFPPYYAMPLMREEAYGKHPELEGLLRTLGDCLTDEVMQELNYEVDEEQKTPEAVAHDFLLSSGLI
ncbi:MAG: ABC transporter permease subunit [Bacilli bacterium]|jgi:osmoprotectant transport system permease protein|nr:ABC transporter permease subunit [Bacilli bacterium]